MKLQSVRLLTSDPVKLKAFYTHIMELPLLEESRDSFTLKAGTSQLTFERSADGNEAPYYHFAFDIPGNKMDESIAWLNSKGITLNELPQNQYLNYSKSWNSTSVYFYDHGGNIVEFIARHNLNHLSAAPFSFEILVEGL
jgi:catechol-2,3-dioxygenase